ncbi:hypothetical protein ABIF62_007636 [Bradyrhizobium japonicum]
MHKFHSIAALCGDGLRPELRALFERLAIDPYSGLRIRSDGMLQSGPDPTPVEDGLDKTKSSDAQMPFSAQNDSYASRSASSMVSRRGGDAGSGSGW